jgi:hypothetical protein
VIVLAVEGGGDIDVACVTMLPLFDVAMFVSTGGEDVGDVDIWVAMTFVCLMP